MRRNILIRSAIQYITRQDSFDTKHFTVTVHTLHVYRGMHVSTRAAAGSFDINISLFCNLPVRHGTGTGYHTVYRTGTIPGIV